MRVVRSAAIEGEIQQLERELGETRSRLEEDSSSFSSLESQVAELRERLAETHKTLEKQELRLKEKRAELDAAQRHERLDAYTEDIEKYREARKGVSEAASTYLARLDAYDGEVIGLRKLHDDMREAFGEDERVAEVAAALAEENAALSGTWDAIVAATQWRRVNSSSEVEAEATSEPEIDRDVSEDLKNRATDGRAARILDYFSKD
jgi:chromosome segregation ATPase